jgi:imidazolonepropionase-like amidohydrolase
MVTNDVTVVPTLSIFPRGALDIAVSNLHRFISAGGRVVYGTDLGNAGPQPGIDELEVTRMEAAGMSVVDIVRAATVTAAEWLGLADRGVIDPGLTADLVVIDGDILEARALTRVTKVFRAGREVR